MEVWSCRINGEHRFVCVVEKENIVIISFYTDGGLLWEHGSFAASPFLFSSCLY
ncbi:MAG: hypothetical protein HFG53_13575 [Lachnospiraceae bacterium]|nr:hypothetical protein [Lachnospiraceae bacterium]